jgi:hypothetical protein
VVRARRVLQTLLLLPLGAGGCSVVLDIQDAHFDASLEEVAGKSSSGAGMSASGGVAAGGSPGAVTSSTPSASSGAKGDGGSGEGHSGEAGATTTLGGAGEEEPSLCDRYCRAVLANCTGQLEQYSSLTNCQEVCQRLPAGTAGDHDVNTVECRLRQAGFAMGEPLLYCKSSGPVGQDKCGSNCAGYCSLMQQACTADSTAGNLEPSYYADEDSCLSACAGLMPGEHDPTAYSSSPTATPSSYVGNNVYCRTYHVAAALGENAPDEHCPHARGGDPCTSQ